jgi:hypothetical protein
MSMKMEPNANAKEEIEIEEASEASEPTDLFEIFLKPVDDMTDVELVDTISRLRSLRKVRINTKKGKSVLDQILEQLSPENAQKVLQHLKLGEGAGDGGKVEQDHE